MRKDWEYKKLGEVAFYPNDKISVDKIGANHYVGVENLLKDKAGILFSDQLPNAATATCFKYNDILLGNIRPYLKKIWLSNTEGGASGDVIVIRTSSDNILPNYLFKLLSSDKFFNYFNLYTKGAKMPRGDKNAIAKFIVPTPPKPTQLAIVAELDKINELIQLKKQQLKDYDQLAQSIFHEMFGDPVENEKGWEVKKLGDFASSDLGKTLNKSKDTGELYSYLCAINIKWNEVDTSILKETRFEKDELNRYSVTYGDLLVCEGGDTGRAAIWNRKEDILYQNALHRIRLKSGISNIYILYFLWKLKKKGIIDDRYSKGVTIKHLVKSSLLSIPVPLPPLPLQQQFAARIEAIERQKQQVSETIKDLETLLASRMQYWFD